MLDLRLAGPPLVVCLLSSCLGGCTSDQFATNGDGGSDALVASDSPSSDASTPDSSTVDGSASDGNTITPFSCNPPPAGVLLCDNFDVSNSVTSGWTAAVLSNSGAFVSLDSVNFVSSPDSFRAEVQPGANQFGTAALLYETTTATFTTMVLRTNIRISTVDTAQEVELLELRYNAKNLAGAVNVMIDATPPNVLTLHYQQPATDGGLAIFAPIALGNYANNSWQELRIDFTQGPSAKITVLLNNLQVANVSPPFDAPLNGQRDFQLGLFALNTSSNIVNYDNVFLLGL